MEQLMELLKKGVTAAHTIDYVKKDLINAGYEELFLGEEWKLKEEGKYYVNLYGTNGFAFSVGHSIGTPAFRIAMAHSDYPNFQIKPNPVLKGRHVSKLNVEIYGGMYQKSWLDRPLGIAGKVIVKGESLFAPETLLYKSDRPLAVIPSLAIHMDRELNKKGALDVAKELVPLVSLSEESDLLKEIAESLGVDTEDILDYDLFLFNMDQPVRVGLDAMMLSAPRLDNLTSVGSILAALKQCDGVPDNTINAMMIFDNEEVGSLSKQGADSELLTMLLEKIGYSMVGNTFQLCDVVSKSFLLSVDVAHAHHPNYEEKSDITNKAYMGQGFAIKRSVGQKYGTTAESAAVLRHLCSEKKIPYTVAINRTGIPGGSTLGPIVTSHLPFPCADIGMPVLAMHSATELGAVPDYEALKNIVYAVFQQE